MGAEQEFNISKHNRRRVETERYKEITHPFKITIHTPTSKDIQKRAHKLERKAAQKRNP